MRLKLTALCAAIALGTLMTNPAGAMNIHVNGKQVILSGDVTFSDMYVLGDVVDRLRQQGRTIDTLVMRNSNGGSVYAGYNIGDFARRNQLTTVVSGYCISACSMMFVGGQKRAFADGDQPLSNQYIGIHGVSLGDAYKESGRGTPFYEYFIQAVAGGDPSKTDATLIDDAFSDHGSSYARIFDPAAGQKPSVFWCHPSCGVASQYKAYPRDDAYNTGFVTEHAPVATTDVLQVTHDVSGNINPNYYNAFDPAARPYINAPIVNLLYAWDPLTTLLLPDAAPMLTPEAYLDDKEVELYNRLSVADRQKVITQYVTAYFLQSETPAQLQQKLTDPKSDESVTFAQIAASRYPIVDRSVLSVDDAYGIIKVSRGATWSIGKGVHGAADAMILDGGNVALQGGALNISDNYVTHGASLGGYGSLGARKQWATVYVDAGARIHPTGAGLDVTGNIRLNAGSVLALDVTPALADGLAPLRFGLLDADTYSSMSALSIRDKSSVLALNVAPGFYQPGNMYALVGYSPDLPVQLAEARKAKISPGDIDIVYGSFRRVMRAGADGAPVAGYEVDPTVADAGKAVFHPFDGSLISYALVQEATGLGLLANDPFKDASFCGSAGCGLGGALSAAAQSPASRLSPLLGALEFSTADQARRAAGQLRGESYGGLRTATLSLLNEFGGVVERHLRAVSPEDDRAANISAGLSAQGIGAHAVDVGAVMDSLATSDEANADSRQGKDGGPAIWGRVFGHRGRLDGDDGVAGLRQHSAGVMLGVDQQVDPGFVAGGSLGYGKLRADGTDNGFHGRVRALDARLYADYRYDREYLVAGLAYTRLTQTVRRSVDLPLLSGSARSRFSGNALSLHLEHGWSLEGRNGVVWQPILPSIDMVRLPAMRFAETGNDVVGLDVNAKHVTDTRLGAGLAVYKRFPWGEDGDWTPHARVLLQHRFSAHENTFTAGLQGFPEASFAVASQREGLNHAQVDLGISASRNTRFALSLDYLADVARGHRDQGLALGARYRW